MAYTLGKPGCPKCKGNGVYPGEPRKVLTQDERTIEYPTVVRCACLEKPADPSAEDLGAAKSKPDAQSRAAGEKNDRD